VSGYHSETPCDPSASARTTVIVVPEGLLQRDPPSCKLLLLWCFSQRYIADVAVLGRTPMYFAVMSWWAPLMAPPWRTGLCGEGGLHPRSPAALPLLPCLRWCLRQQLRYRCPLCRARVAPAPPSIYRFRHFLRSCTCTAAVCARPGSRRVFLSSASIL
jgi:hypothetical protein